MKQAEFQKLLFRTAVNTIAIDGYIHENELREIKSIVDSAVYFMDLDYEKLLEESISYIEQHGIQATNDLLNELQNVEINERQKISIIDVMLRVIKSDNEIHENEINLLHLVCSKINISDEVLLMKFPGHVDVLYNSRSSEGASSFETDSPTQ